MKKLAATSLFLLAGCQNPLFVGAGISEFTHFGWQNEIDAGLVTNITTKRCLPDHDDCVIWLSGHRTTHGSVFRNLTNLQVGSRVQLIDDHTHTYEVYDIIYGQVGAVPPVETWTVDLVMQTSIDDNTVVMYVAREI